MLNIKIKTVFCLCICITNSSLSLCLLCLCENGVAALVLSTSVEVARDLMFDVEKANVLLQSN